MKVIAFVPLPPPYAGPEIATQAMLDALSLPAYTLRVVKANVRTSNEKKGNFDGEGLWRAFRSLCRLFWACLCFRPQKVYLLINPSRAGFLRDAVAVLISKFFFCKVIGHYHGSRFQHFYETAPLGCRFVIRTVLGRLHGIMVQAERLKSVFSGLIPESKITVLYNGVSDECLERGSKTSGLRKTRKRNPVTFLFLNHIAFTKGFYDLMTAYYRLLEEKKKIRLLVAGDFILNPKTQLEFLEEPHRRFYQKHHPEIHRAMLDFVRDNPSSGVEYHGLVSGERKFLLFEEADVLVLPSHTEGFPNVVLEAMAFGLGLIVTPVGALPEILKEPDNALFVERGNTKTLLKQMERLIELPSLCLQMGKNNRELVAQKYHMKFTAGQFEKFILNQKRILY